ncbi:MAG: hypothetical protein ACRDHB_07425, partial [Actinomycetota bacterium]
MRSSLHRTIAVFVHLAVLFVPLVARAQQIPTPGETPEVVKEWTWYLSWPIALLAIAFVLGFVVLYLRYSRRFFGREEPPVVAPRRRQPQFAMAGAAPVATPRVDQVAAASTTPPAQPAAEVATAADQQPTPPEPAEERRAEQAGDAQADASAKAEAAPAPTARPPAEHVEPDQEVYERELQAQLDKGTDRRVAEGRAKA